MKSESISNKDNKLYNKVINFTQGDDFLLKVYELIKIIWLVIFAGYDEKSFELNSML